MGLSGEINHDGPMSATTNVVLMKVDASITIKYGSFGSTCSCRLSNVKLKLSYLDYVCCRRILNDNVGKKVLKSKWDNLEVAWEKEIGRAKEDVETFSYSNEVTYSKSARLVRYGQGKLPDTKRSSIMLKLFSDSLSLVLRRDHDIPNEANMSYDMILSQCLGIAIEAGRKEDGDSWLNISLEKIFIFDLGREGRRKHNCPENMVGRNHADDFVSVLLQGYNPPNNQSMDGDFNSQIVLKFDQAKSSDGTTKAVAVFSLLSIFPMMGPLRDVADFLLCKWGMQGTDYVDALQDASSLEGSPLDSKIACTSSEPPLDSLKDISIRTYQLHFVCHYPRLVFASDEEDINCRALVLRG